MAIKKESLAALLVKTGVAEDQAKALAMITAEAESEVAIPDTHKIMSTADYNTTIDNVRKEATKAAKEIVIKDLKTKAGLEFEGKDPDKFIEEFKAHVAKETGVSVDEKVKSRDKTISDLKTALEKVTGERDVAVKAQKEVQSDYELMQLLPENRDPRFTTRQYLNLLKSEYEFGEEEGKPVVKKSGTVLKNDKFEPLDYKAVIQTHFETAKWIAEAGSGEAGKVDPKGRGAGGAGSVKLVFKNLKEFNTFIEQEGVHPGSEKASGMLREAIAANPDIDLNTA